MPELPDIMKYCRRCDRCKPITEFSKDSSKGDGLRAYCKECMRVSYKQYYSKNLEKVLGATSYYKKQHRDWYKQYNAKYKEVNREILKGKNRIYYQENREKVLRRTKKWSKNNPRIRATIDHRRRARELNQLGFVSDNIEVSLWKEQKGECFYCRKRLSESNYHQEHKTPLSRGGLHDDKNLCLSCPQCNFRKGSKTEKEFRSLGGV
jgi:5-methylcytosine-specific restriction endonuclease McrA